jgi:hypothetical protein
MLFTLQRAKSQHTLKREQHTPDAPYKISAPWVFNHGLAKT